MKQVLRILKFIILLPLALTFLIWGPFLVLTLPVLIIMYGIIRLLWEAVR